MIQPIGTTQSEPDRTGPDLVLALDGVGGLEDGPGRLLPEHIARGGAPGRRGGVDAVGGVGLAVAELGQRQRRRGAREARDVGGQVAQQRRLVQRRRRVHRPQQVRGQLRHQQQQAWGGTEEGRRAAMPRPEGRPRQRGGGRWIGWDFG